MNFSEAWKVLKEGKRVKLPTWSGYWEIDKESNRIMMHCKDGVAIPLFETQKEEYTIENIASTDWIEATEENCPLLGGRLHLSVEDALRYAMRGCKMKNETLYPRKYIIVDNTSEETHFLLVSEDGKRMEHFSPSYKAILSKDYEFASE